MRLFLLATLAAATSFHTPSPPQSSPIIIRADRILDGKGGIIRNGSVTVVGAKITKLDRTAPAAATYDLRGLTLLPGLIDAHSHLTWYFNRQGRYHTRADGDTPVQSMLSTAGNAYATLMAGVTTIQSPGSPEDKDLREWIALGQIPGPRVITSLNAFNSTRPTPDSL